jgi:hypothetical protein
MDVLLRETERVRAAAASLCLSRGGDAGTERCRRLVEGLLVDVHGEAGGGTVEKDVDADGGVSGRDMNDEAE